MLIPEYTPTAAVAPLNATKDKLSKAQRVTDALHLASAVSADADSRFDGPIQTALEGVKRCWAA